MISIIQFFYKKIENKGPAVARIGIKGHAPLSQFLNSSFILQLRIDFKNKEININKTINFVGKDPIIGPPKTNNSYRILGMSNTVFNILKWSNKNKMKKTILKEQYINPNIVFSTPLGDYIHRNNINKRLNAVKKGTDYEYITVHFLRHANATLLIMNDVDIKVVSSHLGHNDIQTTANIYADVLKSKEHQIAQLIEFNLEDDQ